MKQHTFDENKLHPKLKSELSIAIDTTKDIAMIYYPF